MLLAFVIKIYVKINTPVTSGVVHLMAGETTDFLRKKYAFQKIKDKYDSFTSHSGLSRKVLCHGVIGNVFPYQCIKQCCLIIYGILYSTKYGIMYNEIAYS